MCQDLIFRISNILCALGYSQLKRLNKLKKRKKIFNYYLSNIDKKKVSVQNFSKNIDPLYWTFFNVYKRKEAQT